MVRYRVSDLNFPVKPSDIDAGEHFYAAFSHCETETSAQWLVKLCQREGSWGPFPLLKLYDFYHEAYPNSHFSFNRLITTSGDGWVQLDGGDIHLTNDFVINCFKASPVKPKKA